MNSKIRAFLDSHQKILEDQATPNSQREAFELAKAAQAAASYTPSITPPLSFGQRSFTSSDRATDEQ